MLSTGQRVASTHLHIRLGGAACLPTPVCAPCATSTEVRMKSRWRTRMRNGWAVNSPSAGLVARIATCPIKRGLPRMFRVCRRGAPGVATWTGRRAIRAATVRERTKEIAPSRSPFGSPKPARFRSNGDASAAGSHARSDRKSSGMKTAGKPIRRGRGS